MVDPDVLYNTTLSSQQAVLALLGLSLNEGLSPGELIEVTREDALQDTDTGVSVPVGYYRVVEAKHQLVHIVQYDLDRNMVGGKEYTVHEQQFEECLLGGDIHFYESVDEGRKPGTVTNPAQIRAMFKKGYLKQKDKSKGATELKYDPRAHKTYQSGRPTGEHRLNKIRAARKRQREASK